MFRMSLPTPERGRTNKLRGSATPRETAGPSVGDSLMPPYESAIADDDILYPDWASDLEVRGPRDLRLKEAILLICNARRTEIDAAMETRE